MSGGHGRYNPRRRPGEQLKPRTGERWIRREDGAGLDQSKRVSINAHCPKCKNLRFTFYRPTIHDPAFDLPPATVLLDGPTNTPYTPTGHGWSIGCPRPSCTDVDLQCNRDVIAAHLDQMAEQVGPGGSLRCDGIRSKGAGTPRAVRPPNVKRTTLPDPLYGGRRCTRADQRASATPPAPRRAAVRRCPGVPPWTSRRPPVSRPMQAGRTPPIPPLAQPTHAPPSTPASSTRSIRMAYCPQLTVHAELSTPARPST